MYNSTEKLLVYSASAGAGKTYTIAYEFIAMMSLGEEYKDILAVTFTNKASEEMKSRIVKYLYQISNVEALGPKAKKETDDIIEKIDNKINIGKTEIIKRAKRFFAEVLHDYSFFSVSTIDSFFQKIVRNLTYELGMQQNYELELNTKIVISQLVDDIMLQAETNQDLNDCIAPLIESNIENDRKWSPKKAILDFVLKAMAAEYRCPSGFDVDDYKEKQKGIIDSFCTNYRKCAADIAIVLEKEEKKAANPYKWLLKLNEKKADSSFLHEIVDEYPKCLFSTKSWFNKGASQFNIDKVNEIIRDFEANNSFTDYSTALVIYDSIDLVKLLDKALGLLRENLERDAIFLLSEVPSVLSEIIETYRDDDGSVAVMPFIFEKVGTKFNHFMIDEFQDTSDKQWNIFRTMLEDSLSHKDNSSIIVGDIKQSIYSWRGGDWRILWRLKEGMELQNYSRKVQLNDNYRTAEDIVKFNNAFFEREYSKNSSFFGEGNDKLYSDVEQGVIKNVPSEIKISLYESSVKKAEAKEYIFGKMLAEIERLQSECGVKPSQITILVRKKPEASLIARSFCDIPIEKRKTDVCYDVVSNEALFLVSNMAVRLIIAYMRSMLNPSDMISLVEAAYLYRLESIVAANDDFDEKFSKDDLLENLKQSVDMDSLSGKQAFEVVDILVDKLKLNKIEANIPFLIAFRNVVHNFSLKSTDLQAFIEYWDERGIEETITIPENQEAIKILTVHKSKGLESDYIFIPFCDWDFVTNDSRSLDYLFVTSDDNPDLQIPVANKSSLALTKFADEYQRNLDRLRIESFNLLYVAFTRAKYGLYVSAFRTLQKEKKTEKSDLQTEEKQEPKDVSYMLWEYFSNPELDGWEQAERDEDGYKVKMFVKGGLAAIEEKQSSPSVNDSILRRYPICENPEGGVGVVHHLSDEVQGEWTARVKGTKYHSIFENIVTEKDVQPSVMQLFYSGEIDKAMAKSLIEDISASLRKSGIRHWFEDGCKVYNEFNIIDPSSKDDKLKRPDRVMVFDDEVVILDYKFGEEKHDRKYAEQVLDYADLISKMKGFEGKKFSKYVWYYFRNELAEIKSIDDISIKNLT